MLKPLFENIPSELTQRRQWGNWREEPDKDKPERMTKPPYHPNGKNAKPNDPQAWSHFLTVKAAYKVPANQFDGVGFLLTENDPYVGVDFDDCRCPALPRINPSLSPLDAILPEITAHIRNLNSYTEISPSGKGIRVFVKGTLPVKGRKKGDFEIYQNGRYVTVTGHHISGFPKTIEPRQMEIDSFCKAAQFSAGILLVFRDKAGALHKHAAGAGGNVKNASMKWLNDADKKLDDGGGGKELTALLTFAHGEVAEEVFVYLAKGVALNVHRNGVHGLEEFFE